MNLIQLIVMIYQETEKSVTCHMTAFSQPTQLLQYLMTSTKYSFALKTLYNENTIHSIYSMKVRNVVIKVSPFNNRQQSSENVYNDVKISMKDVAKKTKLLTMSVKNNLCWWNQDREELVREYESVKYDKARTQKKFRGSKCNRFHIGSS